MNGEVSLYKRAFEKSVEFRFKQNYERTAKVVHMNGFREKCGKKVQTRLCENGEVRSYKLAFEKSVEIRFKQGYERSLKSVHTNVFLRIMWKLGSNKFMRERRRPFIQTCF